MADLKITELTAYTPAISTDLFPIVDITTTTTKKITVNSLLTSLPDSLISDTDSTDDLGSSSKYWANGYVDKIYLNSTAYLDGSNAGKVSMRNGLWLYTENGANVRSIDIEQYDTTNNPMAVYVRTTSSGEAFRFEQNGVLGGSKTCFAIYSNQAHTNGDSYLIKVENDNASNTIPTFYLKQDGAADGVQIHEFGNAYGLRVEKTVTVNDTRTWAMYIKSDNAGTGTALPGGIYMADFSVDEPIIRVVNDAISTPGTLSKQIAVDIDGTTYYLYAYTTGS